MDEAADGAENGLELVGGSAEEQRLGSPVDAEAAEEQSLGDRSKSPRAGVFDRYGESAEVDVVREVGLARVVEDTVELMPADRLQGIAGRTRAMAVVDNQRRPTVGGDARGQ